MISSEPPSTIATQFAAVLAERGDHAAIVTNDETISYAELDRRSGRMARALLAAGAGKGARVALLASDGIFWSTTFLAALRIGALVTVISTLVTPRELAHILRYSDTQFFISERQFLKHDYARTLEAAFADLAESKAGKLWIADAPYLRSIWLDNTEDLGWAKPIDELLAGSDAFGPEILTAVEAQVYPSDDAVIVYTSGSTSLPKAVVHTQWNIARHPPELAKLFLIQPEDRMLPMLPAFWLGGMAMFFQVLSQGATLVYPPSPQPEALIDTIKRHKVNRVNGWGDGLTRLRDLAPGYGIDIDSIVGLGHFRDERGELIPPQFQANMLGMSETFAPHSAEPLNFRMPPDKLFACGRPVNGYERRVVDPETNIEVPVGEVGELQLRSGALMKCLYKRSNSEVFTPDGFYPTGDLVLIDEDDCLYFVARRNDMIKTRAANVSRLEVEAALLELPEVETAVVTGLDHAAFGQIVAAAVVPAEGTSPSEGSLRAALRDTLSSYKVPRRIVFVSKSDIPRTATGKIKLHAIGELIEAHEVAGLQG